MAAPGRTKLTLCVAAAALGVLLVAGPSNGQVLDDPSTSTTTEPSPTTTEDLFTSSTTTAPPAEEPAPSSSTTAPPSSSPAPMPVAPGGGSPPPPDEGDGGGGTPEGDGGSAPPAGRSGGVPAEAQRIIDSVQRTPANGSADLLAAVQPLVDLGLSREEAIRIGFGRFPVAGAARYSHDWLYPRWGPGFRFHLGTDVFASYGTPLRAAVDGIVESSRSSLGGLSVKLFMDDGTYFYYAHLSALPEGFTDGMAVRTGDIVGYVGDSGNAKGTSPHLHLGIYPKGGDATDPKPVLDQFLRDAMDRLPGIIAQVEASRSTAGQEVAAAPVTVPPAPAVWARLRPLMQRTGGSVPTEVLYQTTGNPSAGGVSVARTEAERLAASIDWDAWKSRSRARRELLRRSELAFRAAFGPIAGGSPAQLASG